MVALRRAAVGVVRCVSFFRPSWWYPSRYHCRTSPAVPANSGVAMEVPSSTKSEGIDAFGAGGSRIGTLHSKSLLASPSEYALTTLEPGAMMSGLIRPSDVGPRLENGATWYSPAVLRSIWNPYRVRSNLPHADSKLISTFSPRKAFFAWLSTHQWHWSNPGTPTNVVMLHAYSRHSKSSPIFDPLQYVAAISSGVSNVYMHVRLTMVLR
mmetsp:Transcript_15738/g.29711  ORF Transcript_15738/g.29711 Transcript_15738/m.29711 type:complete len:210 (+) Transcript_15738:921-1550(+)